MCSSTVWAAFALQPHLLFRGMREVFGLKAAVLCGMPQALNFTVPRLIKSAFRTAARIRLYLAHTFYSHESSSDQSCPPAD